MLNRQFMAFWALVTISFTFFAVVPVIADPLLYPAETAPYECVLTDSKGNTVTIEAGPDGAAFPYNVPCPDGSGQCSKYDYRFTYDGMQSSQSFVSVASDLAIFYAFPNADVEDPLDSGDSSTKLGLGLWEQRTVRFNSNASTVDAYVITTLSAARVSTAGAKSGKFFDTCLLAGPGVTGGVDPHQSVLDAKRELAGACVVNYRTNPAGHIVPGSMAIDYSQSDPDCTIARNGDEIPGSVTINGQPALFADGQASTGSGTCYQWFSNGGWYAVWDGNPPTCP